MSGLGLQSLAAVFVVLGLVAAMAWLVRRGAFAGLRHSSRAIAVETAVPIGERRSLIIVAVEGRRLLLGLTPTQISMVTELGAAPVASVDPGTGNAGSGGTFEQLLVARAREMFSRAPRPTTDGTHSRFGDILQLSTQES